MIEGNKRTITELITRYELEPTLRDIYVEGRRDQISNESFFDALENFNVRVYEICTIDFSFELESSLDLELRKNNRNKVITLAFEIFSRFPSCNQIRCIADRDFDIILEIDYNCPILLFTDYTCIEMYLFNERTISKFLIAVLRGFPHPTSFVLKQLSRPLQRLFLIRLVSKILRLDMEWLKRYPCVKCKSCIISFDEKEFIKRYLNKNSKAPLKDLFLSKIEEYEKRLSPDPRNQIHGHDFINLLAFYVKKCGRKEKFGDPDVVEGSLFGCLENNQILEENLFKTLNEWT